MKNLPSHLLSLGLAASLLFSFAAAGFSEEKPLPFTNADIEKYRHPSDTKPQEQRTTAIKGHKDDNREAREKREQESWCKRATIAKNKIDKARRDVREREEDISREQSKNVRTSRKIDTLQGRLTKAKDHLFSAERDLNDIEDEAHRKGIRPGWLRCQFD